MDRISLARVEAWVSDVLQQNGAAEDVAASVTGALVGAEILGLGGHGLSRLPTYVGMLKSGKIDGRAVPATRPLRPGVIAIDAACGFAYPAIDLAIASLPELARTQGIALAVIGRSNHAGAIGLHVERLATTGLVAIMMANTPEAIAPAGGKRAVFGTNPIGFAAPLAGRDPIIVDLALSKVARGNIVSAKQKGQAIPEGWALDNEGRPTTNADHALAGTMVAMGDAKGAALALMVEALVAGLAGSNLAFEASSFLDGEGPPPETGQVIIAVDPASSAGGSARFADRMTALATAIEEQNGARLPGARRTALRQRAAADGIAISAALIQQFGAP